MNGKGNRLQTAPPRGSAAWAKRLSAALARGLGLSLAAGGLWIACAGLPVAAAEPAALTNEAALVSRLTLPEGFAINAYAAGLGRPRLMVLTPAGDILVSSPGKRVLLVGADRDGDGRADSVRVLLENLANPHGLWLDDTWLYVAEEARVFRMLFSAPGGRLGARKHVVLSGIPTGGHWTRTIKKGPDGWFYVTVGSSCNVCLEKHPWRAAMIRFRPGEKPEIYATGLRNTVGFDWRPGTGELYGVDNGRDWLGDELPPDELNRIEKGGFYGWPFRHGDNLVDPDFGKRRDPRIARSIPPAHDFRAHVAPLSIRFLRHSKAPGYEGAALVAQHGSWNRSTKIGYRLVSLHWDARGGITQKPFLTGFEKDGDVIGRPVDVVEADDGTLYVSDDYAGVIWRVTYRGRR